MSDYQELQTGDSFDPIAETEDKFLTFYTDSQLFGIAIADVVQILGIQHITQIPEYPPYAKGIITIRDQVIPVIDMRLRLNKAEAQYNERTCIIVTSIQIGFIVDAVDEVADIYRENINPPPKLSSIQEDHTNDYLCGIAKVDNRVILLLDIEKILREDVREALTGSVSDGMEESSHA